MPTHAQIHLDHPAGGTVGVDAGLAPLIALLWQVGVDTRMSCEDNGAENDHRVWIQFPTLDDYLKFLDMAAGFDMNSYEFHIVNDINDRWFHQNRYVTEDGHTSGTGPQAWWNCMYTHYEEETGFNMRPSVRFPRAHLGWVISNICAWAGVSS